MLFRSAEPSVKSVLTGYLTDADGPQVNTFAPLLGEHTREVLAEYGFAAADIDALHASGVVSSPES